MKRPSVDDTVTMHEGANRPHELTRTVKREDDLRVTPVRLQRKDVGDAS
jgi:hypothetical protein